MFDADRWVEIWVTITRNKTRSLLTCFGVFWGIFMLVLLQGAGTGLKNAIYSKIDGFSTNSLIFLADRTSEPYHGFNKGRMWNMRNRDLETIRREVNGLEHITPVITMRSAEKNVVYGQFSGSYNVKGVEPAYFNVESQTLYYGRLLNEMDSRDKRKVCLIGTRVNEVLFKDENPCGKYVRVNGIYYQVVGVVKQRASDYGIDGRSENSVFLPIRTLQQTMNLGDIFGYFCVSVYPGHSIQKVIDDISGVLKRQNEIAPNDKQAVMVINIAVRFEKMAMLLVGIDALVWLVGMGSLLAGVIGISNIMMVTVKERTREIGVRRALGAKPWNIISQVMSESLVLTAMAGMLGLCLGVYLLDLIDGILSAQQNDDMVLRHPSVDIGTAFAAVAVLLVCGLLAGLIPAWRAMQIKAIDAIREE